MYSPEERLENYMDQYEHEAYSLIEKHVSKKALKSFAGLLCEFYLEDDAIKLMDIMDLKKIHIAAIEKDADMFSELLEKEFEPDFEE